MNTTAIKETKDKMPEEAPKYEFLPEEKTKEMLKLFTGEKTGWVQVGPKKWFFPSNYTQQGAKFFEFQARPDDIWVVTYPRSAQLKRRCQRLLSLKLYTNFSNASSLALILTFFEGTTWTQELVWLLCNNLDFDTARKQYLSKRFPFLEFSMFNHPEVTQEFINLNKDNKERQQFCREIAKPGYEVIASMPSPRFIKSHFPLSLLPGILDVGCKIIYVARNPKDVAVSWYHLNKATKTQGFQGDFATFWEYFENDLTPWSPYWTHLKEAWALKNHPNLLFMFYEEMKHDFPKAIKKIAKFLNKTYTEEQIYKLTDYLDIKNFRNNPMVNADELNICNIIDSGYFVKDGCSGGWKNFFNPKLEARADKWIEENLKNTDFSFPIFE